MLWYVPSIVCFGEFLSWMDVDFCQMLFLCILRGSSDFILLLIWVSIGWFTNIELSLHPWNKSSFDIWSFWYTVGFSLLILCWEFLHLYSLKILACNFLFFFFCSVCVWFWYQGNGVLIEWIWENSVFFNFLESFEKGRY